MISAPIAQGIRFRPLNSSLPNFDNTFTLECRRYQQSFPVDDDILVQIGCADLSTPTLYVVSGSTEYNVTDATSSVVGDITYWTFVVQVSGYTGAPIRLKVYDASTAVFLSEPFWAEDHPEHLKLEWFNTENAFLLDYSSGFTNTLWLDARLHKLSYTGESSIYSNQGVDTKLKEIVSRAFSFEADVPDYLVEQLTLALAHDHFFINEVEFVASKKPGITQRGTSAIYGFTCELKQKVVTGINTHDVGEPIV